MKSGNCSFIKEIGKGKEEGKQQQKKKSRRWKRRRKGEEGYIKKILKISNPTYPSPSTGTSDRIRFRNGTHLIILHSLKILLLTN